MNPVDRFSGVANEAILTNALLQQRIVNGVAELAVSLAKAVRLQQFQPGEVLIEQGHTDNDLMFILLGEVSIHINGNELARRSAGLHVGEMACIDPAATRSATVCARTTAVAGIINEATFTQIANRYPSVWRHLASELGNRLRQRTQFVRVRNEIPILFLGSSRESLPIVEGIVAGLAGVNVIVRPWTQGVFAASQFPIDDLSKQLGAVDLAALVFGPDDRILSRWKPSRSPRDNVILELGLFMGALSRERSFMVTPGDRKVKIPTDLLGMSPIQYMSKTGVMADNLLPVCKELTERIHHLGPR